MDELSRKLERVSRASGDRVATARVAHEHLRAGRFAEALAALGEPDGAGASSLEVTTRALAHLGLGHAEEALRAVERAIAEEGCELELDAASLREVLEPALAGRFPLGRARAARVLARIAAREGLPDLRGDPDPLVRIAFVTARPPYQQVPPSRVYGSHGGDFKFGRFIGFEAPIELRLQTFEPNLFSSVGTALSTVAEDPYVVETLELGIAWSNEMWGLGGNDHAIDVGVLVRAIDALNALDVLPWRLRDYDVRPYDSMEDDGKAVRRLGRDIGVHETTFALVAQLRAKKLARAPWAELQPLVAEAARALPSLGARACEDYARRNTGHLMR